MSEHYDVIGAVGMIVSDVEVAGDAFAGESENWGTEQGSRDP